MQLDEISSDLFAVEQAKNVPENIINIRKSLPVYQIKEQIVNAVKNNSVVLIKGATGCGKSTQVCQYLLEDAIFSGKGAEFNAFVSYSNFLFF